MKGDILIFFEFDCGFKATLFLYDQFFGDN